MELYDELAWRGLVYDATEGLREVIRDTTLTGYVGFDPTAASLHVGSLLPVMALARLQRCGHSPVGIVGGGTGLIGDPSGKSVERTLMTIEQVEANVAGIENARLMEDASPVSPATPIGATLLSHPICHPSSPK